MSGDLEDRLRMTRFVTVLVVALTLAAAGLAAGRAISRDRAYQRLLRDGAAALARSDTASAVRIFDEAIALEPQSMPAYLERGEARRRLGHSPEATRAALRDFRTAATLQPAAAGPHEALGEVDYQLRRYAAAMAEYQEALRLDNGSPGIFYKLALAARADGRPASAIAALERAVQLNPRAADVHYLLGLSLEDLGREAEAQAAFEQAIALAPASIQAREELSEVHRLQSHTREEIEQLEALAALDPGRVERLTAVALAYSRAGNPDLAATALNRALERFHDNPRVYAALGQVWLEAAETTGDTAALRKALQALEPVASAPEATSDVLNLYGQALVLAKRDGAAVQAFRRAARTFPVDTSAVPRLAAASERLGDLEGARRALVRYLTLVDDHEPAYAAHLGDLSLELDDPEVAIAWYMRADSAAHPDAVLLAHLAQAQRRAGHADAARATIARALRTDPHDPSVRAVALRIEGVAQPVAEKVEPQHQ